MNDLDYVIVAMQIGVIAVSYYAICASRASTQRNKIVDAINIECRTRICKGDIYSYVNLFDGLKTVNFERHVRAVALFRDPLKLYPKYIQKLVVCNSGVKPWGSFLKKLTSKLPATKSKSEV